MYIVKETKRDPLCRCDDNGYAAGRVLIKIKILRFYLKQRSSTLNNLMGRVKTMWEPCVFRARPSVSFQRVANEHIWFFTERDWGQELLHCLVVDVAALQFVGPSKLVSSLTSNSF